MSLYVALSTMHQLGLDIGLGACTVTYVVSAYGMIKPKIMPKAVALFQIISFIIWFGLFLLVASGIGLWLTSKDVYGEALQSKIFYLKLVFAGMATINGLFLNFIVTPAFEKSVNLEDFVHTKEYRKAMILGFIGGVISFTCWYGAFFTGIYVFKIAS